VVERVEGCAAGDVEFEGVAGAGVQTAIVTRSDGLVQNRVTSIPSLVRWASSRRSVIAAVVISVPPPPLLAVI